MFPSALLTAHWETGNLSGSAGTTAALFTPTCTLRMIHELAGGCDFLKCDCEGAEWLISPVDLAGCPADRDGDCITPPISRTSESTDPA
ncbi:MAG: hypothetical protein MZU97_03040 [Bacillus subtilis]|nr:hypothetical protein [Bacillus subtilis]